MDKQSIIIIIVALIVSIWSGWLVYSTYPQVIESVRAYPQSAADIGHVKAAIFLLVKIIPGFLLVGGLGLLCLQKWGLRVVHSSIAIDLLVNLFRLGRHVYFWFTQAAQDDAGIIQYFLDRYFLIVLAVFLGEVIIINLTTRLRNELID